jgi:hypothetical protein
MIAANGLRILTMSGVLQRGVIIFLCLSLLLVAGCQSEGADPTTTPVASDAVTATSVATTTATETSEPTVEVSGGELGPCDIASTELVTAAFGGTVEAGIEGYADNCTYWMSGGAGSVSKVDVFHLGSADQWEEIRNRDDETGGGTADVEGIGDRAYQLGYHGVRDVIFQTGGEIYKIVAFGGATPEQLEVVGPAVLSLASKIVAERG